MSKENKKSEEKDIVNSNEIINQLKGKAYDLIRNLEILQNQAQQIQQQLQVVNAEISKIERIK